MGAKGAKALALAATLGALALAPTGAGAAECAGDECQGPPPAPEEVIPGTAVIEGPENATPRFPKQGSGKKQKPHKHGHRHKHTKRGAKRG